MNNYRSVLILGFCLLLSAFAAAQAPTPSPKDAISLSIVVTETGNRAVTGLDTRDFRIFENQVEQTIVSVKENTLAGDYTLTYLPKNPAKDGSWRSVRVEILGPLGSQLTVRHSAGYSAVAK